ETSVSAGSRFRRLSRSCGREARMQRATPPGRLKGGTSTTRPGAPVVAARTGRPRDETSSSIDGKGRADADGSPRVGIHLLARRHGAVRCRCRGRGGWRTAGGYGGGGGRGGDGDPPG